MEILLTLARSALIIVLVIALTRANGLRSFSKMSSYDFAITVAKGSVLASTALAGTAKQFWTGMVAMAALFLVQGLVSRLRQHFRPVEESVDNTPILLMREGRILEENLRRGQITRDDLMGKLRKSNALRLSEVRAVVLEATGDVSVLHGSGPVDEALLRDVRQ